MVKIFFWSEKEAYGFMSNFYPCNVEIDGKVWPTTEHYFAAMKTLDLEQQEIIRLAPTPFAAKKLGRNVELRPDWEAVKIIIMIKALRHKFNQNRELKELLLSTGEAEIYEDSPYDKIWGTGALGEVGSGLNLLGQCLMKIRLDLKNLQSLN